ncbi:MAG: hypothetical protein E4G93_05645 [Dehalococcoidia bacterium]|nr:MAG: hypothetical protein E4G93_05645 [Dehalococcoidia bacterium]
MAHKAGMIHGVSDNARYFGQLATELMPDIEIVHFVDGGVPFMATDALRPRAIERLRILASFAQESGAEAVLLTCTPFGRLVDEVKGAVTCPVHSVLEIMVDEALKFHGTIGVLGSHPGTLTSTERLLREQASLEGKVIEVETRFCPGAFDAVRHDDWTTHNGIVLANLRELMKHVDVVVAPQPSTERAIREFKDPGLKVPVLTSPRLCTLRLKEILDSVS